ncbi:MAG TPA: ankyrin repeat domain-containing protein [Gammaproteobacteria bacterium]|nr:ankyrin repeat domain-containing protein [Gammaproteobacteria bacterium]
MTTPLIQALYKRDPKEALALIEKGGIDLNRQSKEGATALYLATAYGYEKVVKALLRKNADPNLALRDNATPLYIAAANNHTYIASKLLKYGADQRLKFEEECLPLHIAASKNGNDDTVKTLLDHAASKKNGYQYLISTINDTTSAFGIVANIKYNRDSSPTRKNIRKILVEVLKERMQAVIRSNELAEVNAEIARLQNIKVQVNILQKRNVEKKEKTAMRETKTMITQLQVARMRLENSMAATPANAAICLTVVDGIDKNQLASHLLMTEMTPNKRDDLLNALKELSIEQFDHLKQQLKDFVLLAKKDQAFLAEQGKFHSLFRTNNDDIYNANPFLFILRTGTSKYEQKDTTSFNEVKNIIIEPISFMRSLKNISIFPAKKQAAAPAQDDILPDPIHDPCL